MRAVRGHKPSTPIDGVDVYFNLHKRVWSCRCRKKGLVIHHAPVIIAPMGAGLVVRGSGRQQVLRQQRKNVHAFARLDHGSMSKDVQGWAAFAEELEGQIEISYNPYRAGAFYRKDTGEDVHDVDSLLMLALPDAPPTVWATISPH